jgi:hypothetical protein
MGSINLACSLPGLLAPEFGRALLPESHQSVATIGFDLQHDGQKAAEHPVVAAGRHAWRAAPCTVIRRQRGPDR